MTIDTGDGLAIKALISTTSPIIKSLVDNLIAPKIKEIYKRYQLDNKKYFFPSAEQFNEYFHRTYKKVSIVNTLVFNNSQKLLKNIYIPLNLSSPDGQIKNHKIDGYPGYLFNRFEKLLITDTAGMGKSTMMKIIFSNIVENQIGIPILIELRRLSSEKTIIDEIHGQLNSINKDFNSELLLELLSVGGFILILDGYDEISLKERDLVTADIQNFISKTAKNNKFIITSRPEKALSSFGDFQEFRIDPLKKKEAFDLLRKYDNQGSISSLLIKKLQEKNMNDIDEFLSNPLLVSLLFTAFEHKQVIPFKKYLFYRQVYDANFESHDLTKGDSYTHDKYSKLEIDDFHRVLRHIGFTCLKLQKIEFDKDQLLEIITQSKDFCAGLEFNASDLLNDLISSVPLFTKDGVYFKWAHKSIQEYFAAQFIYLDSKGKQEEILMKFYEHKNIDKFINVLDLFYDMDYKSFRNVIEKQLLTEFLNHYDNCYQHVYPGVTNDDIQFRKSISFLSDSYLFEIDRKKDSEPFETQEWTDMIDNQQDNLQRRGGLSGALLSCGVANEIYCLHDQSERIILLGLLQNKKNSLITQVKEKNRQELDQLPLNISFQEKYKTYKITDDLGDQANSQDNFRIINSFILNTSIYYYQINQETAHKRLNEINAEIEKERDSGFLIDGF